MLTPNDISIDGKISHNGSRPAQRSRRASAPAYRLNSFFAGIGGFDLGFERAGIVPVYHCEKDAFCANILKTHWPDAKLHEDVANIDPATLPEAEVWCGGFPCQDVSVARGWL